MKRATESLRAIFRSPGRRAVYLLLALLPGLILISVNLLSTRHFLNTLAVEKVRPEKTPDKLKPASPKDKDAAGKRVINPEWIDLEIAEHFWKNRLKAAKKDSIVLSIDLVDSVISLDIKGVPVRECKVQEYEISSVLRYARDKGILSPWFAEGFVLQDYWATLPKAPIKIKEAPADTNEAREMVDASPPIEKQDVRFILQLNKSLILQVDQTEPFVFTGWFEKHFRNLQFRIARSLQFLYFLLKGQWPEPELRIKIKLSQSDAKSVFRALPQQAETMIRF